MTNRFNAIRQRQKAPGVCKSPPPPPHKELTTCPLDLGGALRWVATMNIAYPERDAKESRIVDCPQVLPGVYEGEARIDYTYAGFPWHYTLRVNLTLGLDPYCWKVTISLFDSFPHTYMAVQQLGDPDKPMRFPPKIEILPTYPYDGTLTAILMA